MSWRKVPQKINNTNFDIDVIRGAYPHIASLFKFGRSAAISSTESVVWDGGGTYTFQPAAETVEAVSTSAEDNGTGDGARTLFILGLDADYNEVSELIVLNGLTPVVTTQTFLRIFRAIVVTSGLPSLIGDANLGVVTITGSDSTLKVAEIVVGNGQTLMTVYTVPANRTLFITGVSASVGEGKSANFKFKFRNGADPATNAFSVKYTLELFESPFTSPLSAPLRIPEKTDMAVTAATLLGGTLVGSVAFSGYLYDNTHM